MNFKSLVVLYLSLFISISCTDNTTGTVDDTDTQIALNGFIKYEDEKGVPNLVVKIANTEFSDTTETDGSYSIVVPHDTILKYSINIDSLSDSLEIIENNNVIRKIQVTEWISTLPTVYFTQRDISGQLLTDRTDFKLIQAEVIGYSKSGMHSFYTDLWFDTLSFKYSGFVYFNEDASDTIYSVQVKVFDADSHFTGLSQKKYFPSSAGDIPIDPFDPLNAVPKVSVICSTTASPGDSIDLFASVIDSFGGTIVKWEWALNQDSIFIASTVDSVIKVRLPDTTGQFYYSLRVMDNDSNLSIGSAIVNVVSDIPTAEISCNLDTVSINDTVILNVDAFDKYGTIVKIEFNTGDSGSFEVYSDTSCTTNVSNIAGIQNFIVKVTDDDENISTDTIAIVVVQDIPTASISINKDTVSINDEVILTSTLSDGFGTINKIEYNTGNLGEFEVWPNSTCTTNVSNIAGIQNFIIKVTDDDNNYVFDTITVSVLQDKPTIDSLYTQSTANTGDSVTVHAYGQDKFGEILFWSWKIDTNGSFFQMSYDSSDGFSEFSTYKFKAPPTKHSNLPIILKAMDDDSNEVFDTTYINIEKLFTPEKVLIPSKNQSFLMGDTIPRNSAAPIHKVTLTYNFLMDNTEVTQYTFDSIMTIGHSGNYTKPNWNATYYVGDNYPAYNVGWYDAVLFCNSSSKLAGLDTVYSYSSITGTPGQYCTLNGLAIDLTKQGIRLPTEAEWEFAARGNTTGLNYWQDLADTVTSSYCWYYTPPSGPLHTYEVAQKLPNSYGLYDIMGNVWEWVNDWNTSYSADDQTDPTGPSTGSLKIIRGWSFYDEAKDQNCVARRTHDPASGEFNKGFRTVVIE